MAAEVEQESLAEEEHAAAEADAQVQPWGAYLALTSTRAGCCCGEPACSGSLWDSHAGACRPRAPLWPALELFSESVVQQTSYARACVYLR